MSETTKKRYQFKAEIQQLLELLIHSVYASKDIFLRELVSNAADALEKVRFAEVQGQEVHGAGTPLEIQIEARGDDDDKRLVIRDSGVGMTRDEVRTNIGTIAHSGAATFIEKLKEQGESADVSLIGRFGVGFYSVFMVADKVVLTSRSMSPDESPVRWICTGAGSYTIEDAPTDTPRGTEIEIFLKDEEARFAETFSLQSTIRKYSNFIPFPIKVEEEQVNKTTALWREPSHTVKQEDYSEFYKFLTFAGDDPLLHLHFSADVPLQFSALLFVPASNPEILGFGEGDVQLQLYVRRVLIDAENKDLLPKYLRFVRGVVESEDLPLNISRETLQENRFVIKMRETLTRKLLGMFADLAKDKPDEYAEFWRNFGRFLKEGYSDFANKDRIQDLLRFNSSCHDDEQGLTSLEHYVERMPSEQDSIYYLTGSSRGALQTDPRLEVLRKKGIEVLYLYDLADEFVLSGVGTYKEKALVSADQVTPDQIENLGDTESKDESKPQGAEIDGVIEHFKKVLGDRVTDVRESERLVDSPACLVSDDGMSGHMDKMMRAMNKDAELPKRTLELNRSHPLIQNLSGLLEKDPGFVELAAEQIFEGAMLADGYLTDPHRLVARMNDILTTAAAAKTDDS